MSALLSKAEKLAIASAVAAPVRQDAARGSRKITRISKDGAPVGTTTAAEVAKSLLRRSEIEFSVQEGQRPKFVTCKTCGRPIKVPRRGVLPTSCRRARCACGAMLRVAPGKCGEGRCRQCFYKAWRANGGYKTANAKISDEVFLAVVAESLNYSDAMRRLGLKGKSSVAARCRRMGIKPGGAQ